MTKNSITMDKVLHKSLVDALSWASLRELPPKDEGKDVYTLALALVSKKDGSKGYVALKKDENGKDRIVKDFGTISIVVRIDEVYPYLYLDGSFLPNFSGNKKEDRIKWLEAMNRKGNFESMSMKELNREVLNTAIQLQLNMVKK